MSWEEDYTESYPCPCGEGQYIETVMSNDWLQSRTHYEMLCPKCKELYDYSYEIIRTGCKPDDVRERGWVLKSVLQAEKEYKLQCKMVLEKARELYFSIWSEKFAMLKTKKAMYKLLNCCCAYGTFCDHTKGFSRSELLEYINTFFEYRNLKQIFTVCGVDNPDWNYLGASYEIKKEIMNNSNKSINV